MKTVKKISKLYVVAAASGTGKTSLLREALQRQPQLSLSISHTTRAKRPKEVDGVDYHFVSPAEFEHMIAEGAFVEYATVHGNYYGTAKQAIIKQLAAGSDVVLELDWQGAAAIKQQFKAQAALIFVLPPSYKALAERLQGRGQDDSAVIAKRLQAARAEISHLQAFDYLIVNDDFSTAITDLLAIISGQGERLSTERQSKKYADLIAQLLQAD